MSRADPKPGRWLLPLVVAGIIGFTYTFVNALAPVEIDAGPTTTISIVTTSSTTSTSSTTTTTLPPEVLAFVEATDLFSTEATTLVADAEQLNSDWDERTITFGEIRSGLGDLRTRTSDLVDALSAAEVPEDAAEVWVDPVEAAAEMNEAADTMLDGLVNDAGSERRIAALADFTAAEVSLQQGLSAAVEAAGG